MERRVRYTLGRWLVHLGLRIMPAGRIRSELYTLLDEWGTRVYAELAIAQAALKTKDAEHAPE
jgi:hypothetical protein